MAVTTYTSLEPGYATALSASNAPVVFNATGAVSLFTSTSFLWSAGIMISVVAAGFMYMRAGLIRMQASEAGVRKSNEEIKRVTVGLLGVLSLFVILYTFNKGLLQGDIKLGDLKAKPTSGSAVQGASTTPVSSSTSPSIPTHTDDPLGWQAIADDPAMRAQLAALPNGGITVNKSVCVTPTQTSCTTVGGWPPSTPAMLAQLRNTCPGRIMITGGTEAGHQSHGPGKTPVDISLNDSQLESCIRSFPAGPPLSFCKKTYQQFGYVFCDEYSTDLHWHVQ